MKVERLDIRISTEEKELWKQIAAKKDISVAELIRRAVAAYLEEKDNANL